MRVRVRVRVHSVAKLTGAHLKHVFKLMYNSEEIIFDGNVTATETCNTDKLKCESTTFCYRQPLGERFHRSDDYWQNNSKVLD